jgi:hypothetical protein
MEVAVGLEPTKTGFADQRLDRFGIATRENSMRRIHTQICTQTALVSPIYAASSLPNLWKPRMTNGNGGFCRPLPYHLATAPLFEGPDTRSQTAPTRKQRSNAEPDNCDNYTITSVDDFEANLCAPVEK